MTQGITSGWFSEVEVQGIAFKPESIYVNFFTPEIFIKSDRWSLGILFNFGNQQSQINKHATCGCSENDDHTPADLIPPKQYESCCNENEIEYSDEPF